MRTTLTLGLLAVFLSSPAIATDRATFEKKVGKSAPDAVDTSPPVTCVCRDGSTANHNKAGQLFQFPSGARVDVTCLVLVFNNDGSVAQGQQCDTWLLLPK